MFAIVLCVLAFALISVNGTCQSVDGHSVQWWILFQQKEKPYFHQYVDSTNSHRIKEHYPEKIDSVLSRVMSSVIYQNEAEYIIYSSDLINVKDIAEKSSIPTYSKWMHGILGTVSSWDSGFWILHNNLLFPAITNGALAKPGSKAWYATTVGDNSADLFYICLSADTRGNITEILTSIMAGNPIIFKRKLHNHNFLQPYFKEVRSLQTSFGYEMSASIFLDCLYTSSSNVSTNCLFTYAVTTGAGIHVLTRPRGMIKHSSAFCYDDHSISLFDFLSLERRSTLKSGFSHSMFALSGKTDSSSDGITCFGQDVATNAETVAVMVCAHLPTVHVNVVKSARLTQWSCRNKYGRPNRSNMYSQAKGTQETDIVTEVKETNTFVTSKNNNEDGNSNQEESDATYDSDGKEIDKFCMIYDCNTDDDITKEQEVFDVSNWKNPLMKNQKTAAWFNELLTDITVEHNIQNPQKIVKMIKKEKNAIMIKGSSEVSRFLLNNRKAVFALFCQEGCRFCQNARQQFILLARSFHTDYLDFVIVDITEPSLPDSLHVPFTPYVRYKLPLKSQWTDFSGEKYDIEHMLIFLHKAATVKRYHNDEYTSTDPDGEIVTELKNFSNLEIRKRKRRETKQFSEERLDTFDTSNTAVLSRTKRDSKDVIVDPLFEKKHISDYNGDVPVNINSGNEMFLDLKNKLNAKQRRKVNSFLATSERSKTLDLIKSIHRDYYANGKYRNSTFDKPGAIVFDDFNIKDISVLLIHVDATKNMFKCWYTDDSNIAVGASEMDTLINIDHFNTIVDQTKMEVCEGVIIDIALGDAKCKVKK